MVNVSIKSLAVSFISMLMFFCHSDSKFMFSREMCGLLKWSLKMHPKSNHHLYSFGSSTNKTSQFLYLVLSQAPDYSHSRTDKIEPNQSPTTVKMDHSRLLAKFQSLCAPSPIDTESRSVELSFKIHFKKKI